MLHTAHKAIFINTRAGSGRHLKSLYTALGKLEDEFLIYDISDPKMLEKVVVEAHHLGVKTIIAAGGDGTISSIAGAILGLGIDVRLGVLPIGTMNHFARDIGMPLDIQKAFTVLLAGKSTYIDAAKINDHYFINNSSLGLYPLIIAERNLVKRKGLKRFLKIFLAGLKAFLKHPLLKVSFNTRRRHIVRTTPFVFIGNNNYDMHSGRYGTRMRLDEGKLSVCTTQKSSRVKLLRLAWKALRGTLSLKKDLDYIGVSALTIHSQKEKLTVACDGEIIRLNTPIHFQILPRALHIIVP